MTNPATKPVFLYDDCCPLCRGYTKTFTALGWAEREPFSKIDGFTLDALDMDKARHHIPLHDAEGETQYGLDGILDVVAASAPALGRLGRWTPMRAMLDRLYWFVTYNRRHIVTAAPPTQGIDCAPDFNAEPVAAYLTFCGVTATGLAAAAGLPVVVGGAAAAGTALALNRDDGWEINNIEAAGHVGSIAVAAAGAGAIARAAGMPTPLAATVAVVTAARKIWLRRWMRTPGIRIAPRT